MKFTCTIEINQPIQKVVSLFMDKNNYPHWKKDFLGHELTSGNADEVGAVTKLRFKRVDMLETITFKNLPNEIRMTYDHRRGGKSVMIHEAANRFIALPGNKTRYETDLEITKVFGFLPRLIMSLMAGAGKKYAQQQLEMFKSFAEQQ